MEKRISKLVSGLLILVFAILFSCNQTNTVGEIEKPISQVNNQTISGEFSQFLGIEYGMEEHLLQSRLGKFTSGNYSPDSSIFIYYYNRVDRVPISVWVNTKSAKVITVFMEVLSLGENFDSDIERAIKEYGITASDAAWFGLSAEEIKAKMGQPSEEAVSKDGVLLLSYDLYNFQCAVAFKIYPQQDNRCSSISVNWFYI